MSEFDYENMIKSKLFLLKNIHSETKSVVQEAIQKFPENETLRSLEYEFRNMFISMNSEEPVTPTNNHSHPSATPCTDLMVIKPENQDKQIDEVWGSPEFEQALLEKAERVEEQKLMRTPFGPIEQPDSDVDLFDLGISPMKSLKPVRIISFEGVQVVAKNNKGKEKENEEPRGLNKFVKDLRSIPGDCIKSEHEKILNQPTKPGDRMKSPYKVRSVEINVTVEDRRIHEWPMSAMGPKYDPVYSSTDNQQIHRIGLESLAASRIRVPVNVINGWTGILNYDEQFRSSESIKRHFFTVETMGDSHLRMSFLNKKTQFNIFQKTLYSASGNRKDVFEMKNIDLAFFPMLDGEDFYAVVFNLKNPSVRILDNRRWEDPNYDKLLRKYRFVTDTLQQMMVLHLESLGNHVWKDLEDIEQERTEMEWLTRNNFDDSGVFLMRHMETYMGDPSKWNIGIGKEGPRQDTLVEELKMKYVTKIIQHESKMNKHKMMKEVKNYQSIKASVRAQMQKTATNIRWERIHS